MMLTVSQMDVRHINLTGGLVTCNPPKNSIRDARTPQHEEIVFNTETYRSSETAQRPEYFRRSVIYILNNVSVEKITSKRKKMYVKIKY